MGEELDWDSLDSGRLHHATTAALTMAGAPVVVGVFTKPEVMQAVLADAEDERKERGFPTDALIWLYVPEEVKSALLGASTTHGDRVVLKILQRSG